MFGRSAKPIRVQVFGKRPTSAGRASKTRTASSSRTYAQGCVASAAVRRTIWVSAARCSSSPTAWAAPRRRAGQPDGDRHDLRALAQGVERGNGGDAATLRPPFEGKRSRSRMRTSTRTQSAPRSPRHGHDHDRAGVLGDHLYLTQVGDSRAYLVRGGEAHQSPRISP